MVAYGCIVSCFCDYLCVICMHGDCYVAGDSLAGDQRSVGLYGLWTFACLMRSGVSVALGVSPLLRGRDADTVAVTAV